MVIGNKWHTKTHLSPVSACAPQVWPVPFVCLKSLENSHMCSHKYTPHTPHIINEHTLIKRENNKFELTTGMYWVQKGKRISVLVAMVTIMIAVMYARSAANSQWMTLICCNISLLLLLWIIVMMSRLPTLDTPHSILVLLFKQYDLYK